MSAGPGVRRCRRASVLPDLWAHLMQRPPEAERTIAGGELRVERETVLVAQPKQEFAPALGALPEAVLDGQQFLAAVHVGTNEDQDALPIMLEPRREVDAAAQR